MENSILKKIAFVMISFSCLTLFSQDFSKYDYISLENYEFQNFIKDGVAKELSGNFYIVDRSNGGKIMSIEIKRYLKGQKVGEWLVFRDLFNGLKLAFVANYKRNKLNGYYFESDNHSYSKKGFYKDNMKEGLWKLSENGFLEEIKYSNDVKSGVYKSTKDRMIVRGQYINGLKEGVWTTTDSDLGLVLKETYKKGKLILKESTDPFKKK
ncbi:hypothetical protein ACSTS3_11420 [Aquimarina muelleri]|uniref:hypothetical protein n=1 Tax=Aquimarina muelleri TaxID=279356 RepID=UPI003F682593